MNSIFHFERHYNNKETTTGYLSFENNPTVYEVIDYVTKTLDDHGTVSVLTNAVVYDDTSPVLRIAQAANLVATFELGHADPFVSENSGASTFAAVHGAHVFSVSFRENKDGSIDYHIILKG